MPEASSNYIIAIFTVISAIATVVIAWGIGYSRKQLKLNQEIAQLEFEYRLSKEYRELIKLIPAKALFGEQLSADEYQKVLPELLHYFDLSNEQILLHERKKIGTEVWQNWSEGIRHNLSLPVFKQSWAENSKNSDNFKELRKFLSPTPRLNNGQSIGIKANKIIRL